MKYSVFTVTLPEYNIDEAIELVKENGYDGIEWRVQDAPLAEKPEDLEHKNRYWRYNINTIDIKTIVEKAHEIYEKTTKAGLEIPCLTSYVPLNEIENIENLLKSAQIMNCPQVRLAAPVYDESRNYWEVLYESKTLLKKIEIMCIKYGVKAIIEQHMNNMTSCVSACYEMISDCSPKNIGILLDPGNMVVEGRQNYKMVIEILGDYLAHVHLKNAYWSEDGINEYGAKKWVSGWKPIDEGFADITEFIKVLYKSGYNGYLSLEDFSDDYPTDVKVERSINFIKKVVSELENKNEN